MNLKRHIGKCQVCQHPELEAIEREYLGWQTVEATRTKYALGKNSLNRHIEAFRLDEKRRQNKLVALEKLISMGMTALKPEDITGTNVIAAAQLHAKLQGELVDRHEDITVRLEQMSDAELAFWVRTGREAEPGELDEEDDVQ